MIRGGIVGGLYGKQKELTLLDHKTSRKNSDSQLTLPEDYKLWASLIVVIARGNNDVPVDLPIAWLLSAETLAGVGRDVGPQGQRGVSWTRSNRLIAPTNNADAIHFAMFQR